MSTQVNSYPEKTYRILLNSSPYIAVPVQNVYKKSEVRNPASIMKFKNSRKISLRRFFSCLRIMISSSYSDSNSTCGFVLYFLICLACSFCRLFLSVSSLYEAYLKDAEEALSSVLGISFFYCSISSTNPISFLLNFFALLLPLPFFFLDLVFFFFT